MREFWRSTDQISLQIRDRRRARRFLREIWRSTDHVSLEKRGRRPADESDGRHPAWFGVAVVAALDRGQRGRRWTPGDPFEPGPGRPSEGPG